MPNDLSEEEKARYSKLSREQLEGAHYMLRLLHTSPAFRGRALEVIKEQYDCVDTILASMQTLAKE